MHTPTGQTIAEKILSAHVGRPVYAGELIVTPVEGVMATDTTAPLAIRAFREMGGKQVWDPGRCTVFRRSHLSVFFDMELLP